MQCARDLSGKDEAIRIKKLCEGRIEKYSLHSVRSGACKSCPYKYRGSNYLLCCMFGNLPYTWSDESIEETYSH